MLFGFILMKQLKQFTCNFSALAIEDRGCKTTNSSFFAMTSRIIHENIVQAIPYNYLKFKYNYGHL